MKELISSINPKSLLKSIVTEPVIDIIMYIMEPFKILFSYIFLAVNFLIDAFLEFLSLFTDFIPYSEYVLFQAFVLILILFIIVLVILGENQNNSLTKPIAYQNCSSVISKLAMINVALLCFPDLYKMKFENENITVFSAIFSLCTVIYLLLVVMFLTFTSNSINHNEDRDKVSLVFFFTSLFALLSTAYSNYFCILFMLSNAIYGYMMNNYLRRNCCY